MGGADEGRRACVAGWSSAPTSGSSRDRVTVIAVLTHKDLKLDKRAVVRNSLSWSAGKSCSSITRSPLCVRLAGPLPVAVDSADREAAKSRKILRQQDARPLPSQSSLHGPYPQLRPRLLNLP